MGGGKDRRSGRRTDRERHQVPWCKSNLNKVD